MLSANFFLRIKFKKRWLFSLKVAKQTVCRVIEDTQGCIILSISLCILLMASCNPDAGAYYTPYIINLFLLYSRSKSYCLFVRLKKIYTTHTKPNRFAQRPSLNLKSQGPEISRSHFFLTLSPSLNIHRLFLFRRSENCRHLWVDAIHRSAVLTGTG